MRIFFTMILLFITMSAGVAYAADDIDAKSQKTGSVSNHEKPVVPVSHRTAIGVDQIKKKEEAAKGSSKRGSALLKGYFYGFMGGLNSVSRSLSSTDGKVLTAKQKEKRMSFKDQLKLEMERKRQRNARK